MVQDEQEGKRPSLWFVALLAVAIVMAVAGLMWSYSLAGRLTHAEAQLSATQKQNQQLASALDETNAKLRVTSRTLGHRLGAARREMRRRAARLLHRQKAAQRKLEEEQQNTKTQVSSVTDAVGGVKNGLEQTQAQLAAEEAQMRRMQGDLGIQSGLIATNERELKVLESLGGRSYYPFSLRKGQKKTVATVALQLRRVNERRQTYSITVYSGDKKIEKKDRALDEPLQFYIGEPRMLFELVVNKIGHNQVEGYIATPVTTPRPAAAGKK